MSVVNSTKLAPELNFKQLDSAMSTKQYRKVYPANGGLRDIAPTVAGALQNVIFNIPVEVVNLGESYLEYKLKLPAQGAGLYSWIYRDVHGEFDSIQYRDTGSMSIVDVKNAHIYQQVTNRMNCSPARLAGNDVLNGLVPSNALTSDVKSVKADGTTNSLAFIEPQTMAVVSAANAASSDIYKRVYLKDLLPDTYFGLAKNQLLPIETYLEINFSFGAGRVGFSSTAAANPSTAAAAFTVDPVAGTTGILGLCLNLCVETNQDLVRGLKQEVAKGMQLPIPVVRVHQLASTAADSFVYNLSLDQKQHGKKIKKIVYTALKNAPAANEVYDHINTVTPGTGGSKLNRYQTSLDNANLQRDVVEVKNYDDWMNNKLNLKGSLIFNQPIYNYNWIHVDSWSYDHKDSEQIGGGAIMTDGLLLDKPMTYTFNCLSCVNAAYMNTAIVCGLKQLNISSSSFVVL